MATGDQGPEISISLEDAVMKMQAVKQEHREILQKLAQDPGMAPETRWELISHLYDEEDEHMEEIAGLLSQGGGGAAAPSTPVDPRSGLTVGSLRHIPPGTPRGGGGSVGSLRRGSH